MSTIPEIRKNIKFFANGKNKPLVQLATMVADTEVVLAVLEVTPPSEYNTCLKVRRDLYPLLPIDSYDVPFDSRFRERNIMYDRINISTALAIEFARDESGNFDLDDETFYQHPLQLEDVVEVLNNKYGYDVTADDITITYTSSNNYTITAQPNSLQYFGQASVNIGTDDDTPPPVKVPSHDSVWDTTIIDKSTPVSVNGVAVPSTDLAALYTAGLALVQFNDPDMAWVVWTGTLPGEAIFRTTSVDPKISNTNVNQTLTITGQNLFGKYVPFTPNATIPPFNNQVNVAAFAQSMFFTVPYVPTLDRMVNVWIDNVKTSFAALTSAAGVNGLKLVIQPNGDAILAHDGVRTQRVQMRVNIATLPALVRSNSRFIYGIQRGGNNLPLDSMGHEVYNLNFPMKEIVVPDPSTVTPIIPDKAEDFIAALDKIASGLVLPYSTYKSANPTISNVSGRLTLSATVESETQEPRFPAFYFIKEADWLHIQTLPVSTTLGSFNLASTPPAQVPVTVGYLTGSVVPVDGGRLFCMVHDIPMHMNGSFVLDYDPAGEDYVNTTTNLRFDVTYSKASLISPAQANENILRRIATTTSDMSPEAIDRMIVRQQEVDRFVNQINSQWYVNFEFIPYNPPELTEESLDSNGRYVLQLMAIPALAMVQIQGIAARKPEAIIIRVTDTGGLNTENITALKINQTAVIDDETGIGYLLMRHNKSSSSSNIRWTFRCDYDEMDAIYRETATIVNITDSVIDNPVVPFNGISIQECSTEVQYDQFKAIVGAADASLQFLTWDEQDLLIASDSRTGIFTKYGLETPARSTVGRLLIPSEQSNWIRNGDFDQFPEKDPVIVRATNTTTGETYDINMSYLRANVNRAGGIPIRLPAFDDDNRLNQWTFNFKWFGYGNPARPAPSPLPNLIDGSVNPAIQCETKPFRELDSLFNFTSQYIGQEADVMRANLIRNGWSLPATETVIKQKDITVNADYKPSGSQEFWGRNTQRLEVDWNVVTPTHLYMQVIAIDDEIMAGFLGGTFTEAELDTVIFTRATDGGLGTTKEVTLRHIRLNGVNASGRGLIPVVSSLNRVGAFENPAQASFNWKANFVSLNGGGNTTGLIFESADAGPWVAGQLANLSSPIKGNTLAQAITTPDGWGLSLVVPVEGTDGYARQMSPKPLTLPKVGLRSTYGNFDGKFVAMVSETSEPGAGASQMKILNLQNGNMVIVGEADGEVIRDVKFTEKFVLITTDKALFYSKIEPDGSTILNHSFMPNKGYASYNDIVANNKLLLTVVRAIGADDNSRDVSLRAVRLGVNGEVKSPISAYGIGGYLANFNTGFGGGVVSNKIIEVTEDAFLLPLDNELILCKVDHGNKTIITSKLATTGTTAVKMRDVTFGVIDVLMLSTPDKYTVTRIDVGTGGIAVVKPMTDLGFMSFTDLDSLIHMENSKIAFNGYAPGVDGGVLRIANFDANNVLTNFAEIAPLPPQVL